MNIISNQQIMEIISLNGDVPNAAKINLEPTLRLVPISPETPNPTVDLNNGVNGSRTTDDIDQQYDEIKVCGGRVEDTIIFYETSVSLKGIDYMRLIRSDGEGSCYNNRLSIRDLLECLNEFGHTFKSAALDTHFEKMSTNNRAFVMSVLEAEGWIELVPGQKPWRPGQETWYRLAGRAHKFF